LLLDIAAIFDFSSYTEVNVPKLDLLTSIVIGEVSRNPRVAIFCFGSEGDFLMELLCEYTVTIPALIFLSDTFNALDEA